MDSSLSRDVGDILPLSAEVIGSVLVCRNQHPKKENSKMGKGRGKKGFLLMSWNATHVGVHL